MEFSQKLSNEDRARLFQFSVNQIEHSKRVLENITYKEFNKSHVGNISAIIYIIIALGSIFVYWRLLILNIILSVFFGIVTWFAVTFIGDKILTHVLKKEINKSLKFCETPEWVERLKKIGQYSDEEIKKVGELGEAAEEMLERVRRKLGIRSEKRHYSDQEKIKFQKQAEELEEKEKELLARASRGELWAKKGLAEAIEKEVRDPRKSYK